MVYSTAELIDKTYKFLKLKETKMNLNFFSQMLTVTIEAFATLLGISGALFIYSHQRFIATLGILRERIQTNRTRLKEVFIQLDSNFSNDYPSFELGKTSSPDALDKFRSKMKHIKEKYHDLLNYEVVVDFGKRIANSVIQQREREVTRDIRAAQLLETNRNVPHRYYIILAFLCGSIDRLALPLMDLILTSYKHQLLDSVPYTNCINKSFSQAGERDPYNFTNVTSIDRMRYVAQSVQKSLKFHG